MMTQYNFRDPEFHPSTENLCCIFSHSIMFFLSLLYDLTKMFITSVPTFVQKQRIIRPEIGLKDRVSEFLGTSKKTIRL